MRKTYLAIALLATLFLSITAMSSSVKATGTAMLYGHLSPTYDWNEKNLETNVCSQISWYFSNDHWASCSPINDYWTYTDPSTVYGNLISQTNNRGYVTNWWVGDFLHSDSAPPIGHFEMYGQGSNLEDKYIYNDTTNSGQASSVQYFDFIWTCSNGGLYYTNNNDGYNLIAGIDSGVNHNQPNNRPSYMPLNNNTQYGTWYNGNEVGMPYAWTGTTSMSTNGYWSSSGNYCYIGWEGPSVLMQNSLYGTSTNAATFADLYYEYLLGYFNSANNYAHLTFGQSLDGACLSTYGNYYTSTPLFNGYWTWVGNSTVGDWWASYLEIFGNSYNSIPNVPYISTSATADVAITPSCQNNGDTTISWQCADDYGAYYCYITSVVIDGTSYDPTNFGTANAGSITFNDYSSHTVQVNSAPYYYPVTFNEHADGYYGDQIVNSWTEYHVAWEEQDGPTYSHGSNLGTGSGFDAYCDYSVTDPWDSSTDYFNYAVNQNWGGGSQSYNYGIPLDVWTFTWGNTVDIYYQWNGGYYGAMGGIAGLNSALQTGSTLTGLAPSGIPTSSATHPPSTPYIYNATTNTYTPVR
jgi:hypothetical protein